jgi:hypothetical protein
MSQMNIQEKLHMKNKRQKISIIKSDLLKYSKQIGIIDCEIPILVFHGEEFKNRSNESCKRHGRKESRIGGKYTTMLGLCSTTERLIFVNIRGKRNLTQLRITLIHELVHYRFKYMTHTFMEKRIRLILGGKKYPKKHLHCPEVPFIYRANSMLDLLKEFP